MDREKEIAFADFIDDCDEEISDKIFTCWEETESEDGFLSSEPNDEDNSYV